MDQNLSFIVSVSLNYDYYNTVYHVSVLPEMSHTEPTSMRHNIFTINLTIGMLLYPLYQASVRGVTTIRVFNYGK
jgi:hypothetical protein